MTDLSVSDIQNISLELLRTFKQICLENNLRYFLAYGTLLGAVRHKGFIPWDDDIDVCMPREDYNKFIDCCKNYNVHLECNEINDNYYYTFAKLIMPGTLIVPDYGGMRVPLGVYIDIFPLDGLGATKKEAKKRINSIKYLHYIIRANTKEKYYQTKVNSKKQAILKYCVHFLAKMLNKQKVYNKVDQISKELPFDSTEYVGICEGVFYQKEIMHHKYYSESIQKPFEVELYSIPVGYDAILTSLYGDYMTPPPPEKRVPKHDFKAYRLD